MTKSTPIQSKKAEPIDLKIDINSIEREHSKTEEASTELLHDKLSRLARELEHEVYVNSRKFGSKLDGDCSVSSLGNRFENKQDDSEGNYPKSRDIDTFRNQSFFLKAALELLQVKEDLETQILEEFQQTYPDLPAHNEVICSGHLKKGKDGHGQFMNWKARFVVVSAGKMTYVCRPEKGSGYGDNQLSKIFLVKTPKQKKKMKFDPNTNKYKRTKSFALPPGTRCRALDRKPGKYIFEIYTPRKHSAGSHTTGSNVRLWLANSNEDRMKWMQAIQIAASEELQSSSILDVEDAVCQKCEDIWNTVHFAQNEENYLTSLTEGFGLNWSLESDSSSGSITDTDDVDNKSLVYVEHSDTITVPVEWIQSKLQRRRGSAPDNDMRQVFRDMQRDRVEINGSVFAGAVNQTGSTVKTNDCIGSGVCDIISAIAQAVIPLRDNGSGISISEAKALAFSREVLLACNRTQSGGNIYEAVNLLCGNPELFAIIPDSAKAAPLTIDIYNDCTTFPEMRQPKETTTTKNQGLRNLDSKSRTSQLMHRRDSRSDGDLGSIIQTVPGNPDPSVSTEVSTYPGPDKERHNKPIQKQSREHLPSKSAQEYTHSSSSSDSIAEEASQARHRRTFSEPTQSVFDKLKITERNITDRKTSFDVRPSERITQIFRKHLDSHRTDFCDVLEPYRLNGPRADVQVEMKYKINRLNFEDESKSVVANVLATFNRSFVMTGERAVALGQGVVDISLLPSAAK